MISLSNLIDRYHSDSEVVVMIRVVNGVEQGSVWVLDYKHLIFLICRVSHDNIVAQDGYPLQSEGRTPGDEDSGGVDEFNGEVTD